MPEILKSTKTGILALEVVVILTILTIHAATGLPFLLRPVLFVLGLVVGIGVLYTGRNYLSRLVGGKILSGSQFVTWYFVLQVVSVILVLPVLFLVGLSASLAAFGLGFVIAVTYSLWTRLFMLTPFFGGDEGIRAGADAAINAALAVGAVLISLYALFFGIYVLVEYIAAPVIRTFA